MELVSQSVSQVFGSLTTTTTIFNPATHDCLL